MNNTNLFFTSDTHFGHNNIIKYCTRPFADVEEMKEGLIENWNNKVPKDGTVFHLGDFAFGGFPFLESIVPRLNGEIYLILGNHDLKQSFQNRERLLKLFKGVEYQMQINVDGRLIYMTHFPLLCYPDPTNNWALYGHVHSGPNSTGSDNSRLKFTYPNQYDVGVDNNNYTPIAYTELLEKINIRNGRTN